MRPGCRKDEFNAHIRNQDIKVKVMYIFGILSMFYLISKKHQKTGSLFSDGQQP